MNHYRGWFLVLSLLASFGIEVVHAAGNPKELAAKLEAAIQAKDLGAAANITSVTLRWEAAYGRSFQIQTSNDNASWANQFSTTTGAGGTQTIQIASVSARYVRMNGTARATPYGYSLWEFQVYGT